ncbi:hypothetical protein AKJ65_04780 [candidate division MSBL1 archaeon SCGC-AAA259E19]|uniref:Uncharacterized protein n=1 Tax=candidate division MSBL1 archaeon SCGC-AAA259E19 TaxID=1698264 RepID=A0A133UJN9_9EURY|nr:hypothetical protein AKJ65_04780 [candidate division MSBL1 archaeon SCGC-AAA259E19]
MTEIKDMEDAVELLEKWNEIFTRALNLEGIESLKGKEDGVTVVFENGLELSVSDGKAELLRVKEGKEGEVVEIPGDILVPRSRKSVWRRKARNTEGNPAMLPALQPFQRSFPQRRKRLGFSNSFLTFQRPRAPF